MQAASPLMPRTDDFRTDDTEEMKPMILQLPMHISPGVALARIALVLALLSAPMLALADGEPSDRYVGSEIQRSSGAGLVIVFGLQRAR